MLKRIARPLVSVLGIGFLAMLLFSSSSTPTNAVTSVPVSVVNTPLPVRGTVTANINGTSAVNANITNSPLTVGNAGSNSDEDLKGRRNPVLVRDVDNQPYENSVCTTQANRFHTCFAGSDTVTVPSTTPSGQMVKALVIDYVSGICTADPGEDIVDVELLIPSGGFSHFFVPVKAATSDTTQLDYAIAQQTRIYAGAGQTVQIGTGHKVLGTGSYFCLLQITGHYITQ